VAWKGLVVQRPCSHVTLCRDLRPTGSTALLHVILLALLYLALLTSLNRCPINYSSSKHLTVMRPVPQLLTWMAQRNGYLHRIRVRNQINTHVNRQGVPSNIFFSDVWDGTHTQHQCWHIQALDEIASPIRGGKSPSDPEKWKPNMDAVWATIKFATATGRPVRNMEPPINNLQLQPPRPTCLSRGVAIGGWAGLY